uniref:Uncharacterized protein n=1 Tax=Steinernema glaseri TaxID=37863 RepID=A0A1I7XVY9_9BILA
MATSKCLAYERTIEEKIRYLSKTENDTTNPRVHGELENLKEIRWHINTTKTTNIERISTTVELYMEDRKCAQRDRKQCMAGVQRNNGFIAKIVMLRDHDG